MKSEQRGVYEKNVLHIIIGYIYIVKYSDARTVKITKPEEKSMKSFDKKEIEKLTQRRVVGKKEFDVYKTDIKTMFDDTIQTKSTGPSMRHSQAAMPRTCRRQLM